MGVGTFFIIVAIVCFIIYWFFVRETRDRRYFTESEKKEILERQEYTCATCSDNDWRLFELHHKKNWADNGRTNVQNGCALCPACHRKITRNYK